MKKSFILMFLTTLFCACTNCSKKAVEEVKVVDSVFVVEDAIKSDLDVMQAKGKDYVWFESCIAMKNFLDEETTGEVEEVVNVFQTIINKDKGFDTEVYKFQHFADGTVLQDSVKGFWVEDSPLDTIVVPFDSAFNLVMKVNLPKPHSRQCVLRKEVGPKEANPQYIFGNRKAQIYVDAVTGAVTDKNPAY